MDFKFAQATGAAFVVSFALGFLFHGVILAPEYLALPGIYRGPQFRPGPFSVLVLAMIIAAAAMVALYRHGREDKPYLGQGLRFGVLVACAGVIPCYMIGYAVMNVPLGLAVKQIVFEAISVVAMALAIAWFHRN